MAERVAGRLVVLPRPSPVEQSPQAKVLARFGSDLAGRLQAIVR